jgi:hypothetical protein
MAKRQYPLRIEVPEPQDEAFRLRRVGIIAVAGFVIGFAWPRLSGVQLVPSAPVEESGKESGAAETPPAASATAARKVEPRDPAERLTVGGMEITSCRSDEGRKMRDCELPDFDAVARPRLRTLVECEKASEAIGLLSLGFELSFKQAKVEKTTLGKSTSLPRAVSNDLLRCAEEKFENVSLKDVKHEAAEYTVFYPVEFLAPEQAAELEEEGADPDVETKASGKATVSWEVALIRSEPSQDGEIRARILAGTRVFVVARRGDWYKVKYDAKGSEGWVFHGAVGL